MLPLTTDKSCCLFFFFDREIFTACQIETSLMLLYCTYQMHLTYHNSETVIVMTIDEFRHRSAELVTWRIFFVVTICFFFILQKKKKQLKKKNKQQTDFLHRFTHRETAYSLYIPVRIHAVWLITAYHLPSRCSSPAPSVHMLRTRTMCTKKQSLLRGRDSCSVACWVSG